MSARSGIAKAFAEKMATDITGTGDYVNNIYGSTDHKVTHFDKINSFPFVTVTPGPEQREDHPSHFTWSHLTFYVRIYVENEYGGQEELESLIADIETFVDNHYNLSYNVTTPSGVEARETADNTIINITTDEGLLEPNALGELVLTVRYEKHRKIQ